MDEPTVPPELTPEERHLIALLRRGPRSVTEVAAALQTSAGHAHDVVQSLARTVGLVPCFRSGTPRYGLAE